MFAIPRLGGCGDVLISNLIRSSSSAPRRPFGSTLSIARPWRCWGAQVAAWFARRGVGRHA
jgi:hypothetical protein